MAGKGGGAPIRTRKVKPGYDQAFTLPKGTSAAPIKQVATKSTAAKDAKIAAAIAIPAAAVLAKDELKADFKKGWKKGTETLKKIFKPKDKYRTKTLPKIISDLKSSGSRVKYPKE